ncbi:hypothetical protein [Stutzerimonas azotifigens]|uniref:hypothetical protein n=1 Tax=Stutzerimonas azotifigens TaxID=291995 RepID=UPI000482D9BA|nr:hypothetical protein [Stutzerimonas azotifigens]
MSTFWNSWWAFAFMLAPFVIALSGVFMFLFMAYRNLETLLWLFPNSTYVKRQKLLWGGNGLRSRFMLTSSLAAVALWPNGHIKRGELDEDEVRNLPHSIRRRMVVAWWLCAVGMAWLFLAVGLLKLTRG